MNIELRIKRLLTKLEKRKADSDKIDFEVWDKHPDKLVFEGWNDDKHKKKIRKRRS
jgi:hypothetical protein